MSSYLGNVVQKEYSNSTTLLELLAFADQWIDPAQFGATFLANVWNINTAVGFGLDIWGRILGVSRYLLVNQPTAGNYFGFNTAPTAANVKLGTGNGVTVTFGIVGVSGTPVTPLAGAVFTINGVPTAPALQTGTNVTFAPAPANGAVIHFIGTYNQTGTNWQPWGQAPFYSGPANDVVSYALPDQYYRQLLLVKAAANIARCDCPSINALMRAMFGTRGACYVGFDPGNPMNIAYHYGFFPTPVELAIIQSGLFPQPAGTIATYVYATLSYVPFGFSPADRGASPTFVKAWSVPGSPFYMPANATPLP